MTYRHGRLGVDVDRHVPDPKRVCWHSWSSIKLSIYEDWRTATYPRVGGHAHPLLRYQRMLVAAFRVDLKEKAHVVGWNGIRNRIFLRVYQGRGSDDDHERFLLVERHAHRLAQLSLANLRAKVKRHYSELP